MSRTQKRKRSKAVSRSVPAAFSGTGGSNSLRLYKSLYSPAIVAANKADETPTRRRARPRTTVQQYLSDESAFMSWALGEIEEIIEENAEEEKLVQKKKVRLMGLKDKLPAWGVQEEKVTREWEQSR